MSAIRPNTRDAIIEAAFAVLADNPKSSLSDVAAHAGVGRATLHRHFSGRPALMKALAMTAIEELDHAIDRATAEAESFQEGFRLSFQAAVPLANRQWFLTHEGLETEPQIAKALKASKTQLLDSIEDAKDEGMFDRATPTDWIAAVYEQLIYAGWAMVRSGEATPKQAADLAWTTFCRGLTGDQI